MDREVGVAERRPFRIASPTRLLRFCRSARPVSPRASFIVKLAKPFLAFVGIDRSLEQLYRLHAHAASASRVPVL